MKRSQLEAIIREALDEVLNEGNTYAGKDSADDMTKDPKYGTLSSTGKADALNKLKQGGTVTIGEAELDEFARPAKGFRLADPNFNTASFANRRVSGVSMQDIIEFFRENPGAETRQLQTQFGFVRPQVANTIVKSLYDAGILVKLGAGGAIETPPPPRVGDAEDDGEDELPSGYEDPEGGIAGDMSDEEIEASFARMKAGGEDEEEIEDIEVGATASPSKGMSDEEFNAWMSYQELERRLANVKSNILKARKSRPTPGDIQDRPSNEVENLRDLKKRLEDKMIAIVSKFPTVAKDYKAPEIDVPEEEETLDEWMTNKMKYYAGIVK